MKQVQVEVRKLSTVHWKCPFCAQSCQFPVEATGHLRSKHPGTAIEGDLLPKVKQHSLRIPSTGDELDKYGRRLWVLCPFCLYDGYSSFMTEADLKDHLTTQHKLG